MINKEPICPKSDELTDEQIRNWWASENGLEDMKMCRLHDFQVMVRAVAAKLRAALSEQTQQGEALTDGNSTLGRARFVIRGKYGSDSVAVHVGLICELIALAERAISAQQATGEPSVQDVMFEVFEYAKISDGIDQAEGEARTQQRAAMLAQDRKIRKMLASAPKVSEPVPLAVLVRAVTALNAVRNTSSEERISNDTWTKVICSYGELASYVEPILNNKKVEVSK